MALATQCPFCQTTFRVANDQLKLRGGLVRCGHCNEVFDGNAHLLPDQQTGVGNWPASPPPEMPPPITPAMARANAAAPHYGELPPEPLPDADAMAEIEAAWDLPLSSSDSDEVPSLHEVDPDGALMIEGEEIADAQDHRQLVAAGLSTAESVSTFSGEDTSESRIEPKPKSARELAIDAAIASLPLHPSSDPQDEQWQPQRSDPIGGYPRAGLVAGDATFGNGTDLQAHTDGSTSADALADDEPGFIVTAQQRQKRTHLRRMFVMAACVLLIIAASGQGVYLARNRIATAVPGLKPLLIALCQPLHCTVGLQRQIDQLSIESNELQAATPDRPALTLNLLLRNRSEMALAWPDIELTLNDDDEKAVVRRVFAPAEYVPGRQALDAGIGGNAEFPVKLTFTLKQGTASGYRVYLFYP